MTGLDPVDQLAVEVAALIQEETELESRLEQVRANRAAKKAAMISAAGGNGHVRSASQRVIREVVSAASPKRPPRTGDLKLGLRKWVLGAWDSIFTTSEASTALNMRGATVSMYMGPLVKDGLVERVGGAKGKFRLTDKGRRTAIAEHIQPRKNG
jgi:predicted dinucleotide-utilizing enzyme